MSLAPTANLDLYCSVRRKRHLRVCASLARGLLPWISSPQSTTSTESARRIRSLKLSNETDDIIAVSLDFDERDSSEEFRGLSFKQSPLRVEFLGDGVAAESCVEKFLDHFPHSWIRNLGLESRASTVNLETMKAERLTSVESIFTDRLGAFSLLDYLKDDPAFHRTNSDDPVQPTGLALFPSLHHISFMEPEIKLCEHSTIFAMGLQMLLEMLTMRAGFGGTIKRLDIASAVNLDDEDVAEIKRVCGSVKWDGVVEMQPEEESDSDSGNENDSDDEEDSELDEFANYGQST